MTGSALPDEAKASAIEGLARKIRLPAAGGLLNLRPMKRYTGEELPAGARIAVLTNDALGNFVVVTPLLQMLRVKHEPTTLDYYGGTRISELAEASELIDAVFSLHGPHPRGFALSLRAPYDLVVNVERSAWAKAAAAILAGESGLVCGPSLDSEGRGDLPFADDARGQLWNDQEWIAEDITARYPFLSSGFIGEILCRLAYLEGPIPAYRLPQQPPSAPVPDVLISTAASLPEKLWPVDGWRKLVQALRERGLTVGLLGARPRQQKKYWQGAEVETAVIAAGAADLRGRFALPEVVGAIARARLVVTIDNGIVHFACATQTPTVGLFRNGIHRLWAAPADNLKLIEPGSGRRVPDIPYGSVWSAVETLLG
jgi:ADP-heptose:LPS heptosyltransferase